MSSIHNEGGTRREDRDTTDLSTSAASEAVEKRGEVQKAAAANADESLDDVSAPTRLHVFKEHDTDIDLKGLNPIEVTQYGIKREAVLLDRAAKEFIRDLEQNPFRVRTTVDVPSSESLRREDVVGLKTDEAFTTAFEEQYQGPRLLELCPQVDREEVVARLYRLKELEESTETPEQGQEKAELHRYFGEYQEGIACLKGVCEELQSPEGYYLLARAHLQLEERQEARGALEAVLEKDPDHSKALEILGYLYKEEGRIEEAMTLLEHEVTLRPVSSPRKRVQFDC